MLSRGTLTVVKLSLIGDRLTLVVIALLLFLFPPHPPQGAFVICWTPGLVVLLLDGLNCEKCRVMVFKRWLLLLAVLNSVMNPCIYSYKDEEMWATIKNLIRCVGNGTRRQRSSKANSRPHSSGHETGISQPPSEEVKVEEDDDEEEQDMLTT